MQNHDKHVISAESNLYCIATGTYAQIYLYKIFGVTLNNIVEGGSNSAEI